MNYKKVYAWVPWGICLFASTGACSTSEQMDGVAETKQIDEALASWGDFAVDNYSLLHERSLLLEGSVEELCVEPDEELLKKAQEAYGQARTPWILNRVFAFGPEEELPLRLGPRIEFLPARHDDIQQYVSDEEPFGEAARTGAHLRGFAAIEYMLFATNLADLSAESRSCEYLQLLVSDLSENTAALYGAWSANDGNYVNVLIDSEDEDGMFASSFDAFSGIINRMGYVVENIRDRDLRDPMGADADAVQVDLVTSRLSKRSLQEMREALLGIELLYFGASFDSASDMTKSGGSKIKDQGGLSAYARERRKDFDEPLRDTLAAARHAITGLEPSFIQALTEKREDVLVLDNALRNLQLLIQVEIIGTLGLNEIFNDVDGD